MPKMSEVEELNRIAAELEQRMQTTGTVTKDLTIANLIENWRREGTGIPIHAFFNNTDDADAMKVGNWNESNKIRFVSL